MSKWQRTKRRKNRAVAKGMQKLHKLTQRARNPRDIRQAERIALSLGTSLPVTQAVVA